MNRTRNALIGASFQYAQIALSLITALILFPLTIRTVGIHDFGLWLASGEMVAYFLLGDLGVFSVLPWLIASKDGAGDREGVANLTGDSLFVAAVMAVFLFGVTASLWLLRFFNFGIGFDPAGKVQLILILMLGLGAFGFLLRPFQAILQGLQDVIFGGCVSVLQTGLTIGLTLGLVILGKYGLVGLAIATGLPPVLSGLAAAVRVRYYFRYAIQFRRPSSSGCWQLLREGFGPWLAGFGVRLLSGSTSLILVGLGRTSEATLYAATAKAAQILQNIAWILPDSTLVGLSQIRATAQRDQSRNAVLSVLVMYMLTSGIVAFGMLAANSALVHVWLGKELYAGTTVNAVIALNLIIGAAAGGLFKVVGVVGFRPAVGFATLVFGGLAVMLSYGLGREGGLIWVAAGPPIAGILFAIPVGLWLLPKAYPFRLRELAIWVLSWSVRSIPFLIVGTIIGIEFEENSYLCFIAAAVGGIAYLVFIRPVITIVPWPDKARQILIRAFVIPRSTTERLV